MTVDKLAAAFIWPEEMLLRRTHIGSDLDPGRPHDAEPERADEPEPAPFWAALIRRFRLDASSPPAELR